MTPAKPPVPAAIAPAPESLRRLRRSIRPMIYSIHYSEPISGNQGVRSGVHLYQFFMRPFDRVFGLHSLHGLSVHIDDDVLGLNFCRLLARRPGIARQPPGARQIPERP